MTTYEENIEKLKKLGHPLWNGYQAVTMKNEARALYELKHIDKETPAPSQAPSQQKTHKITAPAQQTNSEKQNLIRQYPTALHTHYRQKQQAFLEACTLKMKLNAIPPAQTQKAAEIQSQILDRFTIIDHADIFLKHWDDNKEILTETKAEKLKPLDTPMQIIQRRNTLRSNLTSREKTLKKLLSTPPKETDPTYNHYTRKIQKKQREISRIKAKITELSIIINNQENNLSKK